MKRFKTAFLGLVIFAATSLSASADTVSYNFDSVAGDASVGTNFSLASGGLTATFSAIGPGNAQVANGFVVQNANQFTSVYGGNFTTQNSLYENDLTAFNTGLLLRVDLSSAINSANLNFAYNDANQPGASLLFEAFLNGVSVGTVQSAPGTSVPNYSYGSLAANLGQDFNAFTLNMNFAGSQFAIADLNVNTVPVSGVPEPATTALLILGMAGMLAYVRHHQRKAEA